MAGQVKVLLVITGDAPDGLKEELTRLGVAVNECTFADAEDAILSTPPDLVALAGARGAVELSTILEDVPGGPRMVIVAERKELAKLRGLNREVVISLFAMETTEKVVGQRIESLARRAARRKAHETGVPKMGPKRTAMGLPSVGVDVAKVELMKSPPGVRAAVVEEGTGSKHPGAEPRQEAPPPVDFLAIPGDSSDREEPPTPSVALAALEIAAPKRQAPPRPMGAEPHGSPLDLAPVWPPKQETSDTASDMLQVLDDELLESIIPSSGPPPSSGGQMPQVPFPGALPTIDEEVPVSVPPTLPPQARTQSTSRLTDLALIVNPGELDISSAEHALDNLDSVKLALTDELIRQAHENMAGVSSKKTGPMAAPTSPFAAANTGNKADELTAEDGLSALEELEALSVPPETGEALAVDIPRDTDAAFDAAFADPVDSEAPLLTEAQALAAAAPLDLGTMDGERPTTSDLLDEMPLVLAKTPEPSPVAPALVAEVSPTKEQRSVDEPVLRPQSAILTEDMPAIDPDSVGGVDMAPPEIPMKSPLRKGKSGGSGLIWGTALVVLAGGLVVLKGDLLGGSGKASKEEASERAASKTSSTSGKATQPVPAEKKPAAPTDEAPSAAPDAPAPAAAPVEPPQAEGLGLPRADNPFFIPDLDAPSCDVLLGNNRPEPGTDPLRTSSEIWAEARKAIVSAKLDQANLQMCQAVALNPESAAIEGLAHLYLRLGNSKEALFWADKAEALRPGQQEIGYLRGDAYAFQGEIEKARSAWLQTLNIPAEDVDRIIPVSKDYSVEAGRHLRRGDYPRAELFFRRSVILDPQNLTGLIGLAKTYQKLEKPNYARVFAEMSLKITDVMPEVHVLLGEMAIAQGNKAEAKERFERALAVRPGFFPAKRGLAEVQ